MKRARRFGPVPGEEEQVRSGAKRARAPEGMPDTATAEAARGPQRFLAVQRTLGNREAGRLLDPPEVSQESGWPAPGPQAPLGDVRVHTGPEAAAMADRLGARAFTSGRDIWLGAGESPEDSRLLAHEMAHVVQQVEGRVAGGPGQVLPPGDALEREAEVAAAHGASSPPVTVSSGAAPSPQGAIQRQQQPEGQTFTLEEEKPQFGFAFSGGEALVSSPDIPPPERRETGEWRTLLESQLFFETGQAEVGDDLQETIAHVVEAVQEFNVAHPDYHLRFRITGNASPRWRHSRGQVPYDLNVALSEHRARNTLEQIRNLFRATGDTTCSFETESCAGQEVSLDDPTWDAMVEAQGPIEALGEGRHPDDDWWYDRRVDIVVYRSEFGIVTEQPPPIPGAR